LNGETLQHGGIPDLSVARKRIPLVGFWVRFGEHSTLFKVAAAEECLPQ
jgi:hypothetical protein